MLSSNTVLRNRYLISGVLVQGNSGLVYQASDQWLGGLVAVKETPAPGDAFRQALESEARAFSMIEHPALPKVRGHFIEGDRHYLVADLIPGPNLSETVTTQGPISEQDAVRWADQILDALAVMHSNQPPIFHRNIKPWNLKRTETNHVMLLDFGLLEGTALVSPINSGLGVGQACAFESPEQIRGEVCDARSDLYSLAATLYFLLTGWTPPDAVTRQSTVGEGRPDPLQPAHLVGRALSSDLGFLLHQCLTLDRNRRPASVNAMRNALRQLNTGGLAPLGPRSAQTVVVPTQSQRANPETAPTVPIRDFGAPPAHPDLNATIAAAPPPSYSPPYGFAPLPQAPPRGSSARGWTAAVFVLAALLAGGGIAAYLIPRPKPKPPVVQSRTLVVSPNGTGDHRTIGDALLAARSGDTIKVKPGLYREKVTVNKNITLVGDGKREDIVIETTETNCLVLSADEAVVEKLTLRIRAKKGTQLFAVDIPQGRSTLKNCDVTCNSISAIAVHGPDADPLVVDCRIHDSNECGVFIYANAKGRIRDCEIFGSRLSGIEIKEGSDPTVSNCTIRDGQARGIYVQDKGRGTIEDCGIFNNKLAGIESFKDANPTIRRCRLHNGEGNGVYFNGPSSGTVVDCDIIGNKYPGIAVRESGSRVIRSCKVQNGKSAGILVYENGEATIENCDISGNALNGVEVRVGSRATVRNCRINRNAWHALYVHDNSSARVENSDTAENAKGPWDVTTDSSINGGQP